MKQRLLRILAAGAIVLAPCAPAPADAATYTIVIENHAREPLSLQLRGTECMIKVAGPAAVADGEKAKYDVETDQSGACAVLHRPSIIQMVITGTLHRRINGSCNKWWHEPWNCGGHEQGLRIVKEQWQNGGIDLTIVQR